MPDIMEDPFKSISILYRKSHIWLNDGCAACGLTAAQAGAILIVCDFGTLTQDEIARRLGLDKSVVAKTIAKLVESGFMVRSTSERDKRAYDIRPTDRARRVYPLVKEQMDGCFERMTRRMTDAERREFGRLLALAAETSVARDE